MLEREETALSSRPVRKRTRVAHAVVGVGILFARIYGNNIPLPKIDISALANQILNDQTFPDSNDPRARCSKVMKTPWYQRSSCWQD